MALNFFALSLYIIPPLSLSPHFILTLHPPNLAILFPFPRNMFASPIPFLHALQKTDIYYAAFNLPAPEMQSNNGAEQVSGNLLT